MNIIVASSRDLTKLIGDRFNDQLNEKPKSVLGLTTGSTPLTLGLFEDWIERSKQGKMDFSQSILINPDELLGIPKEHPESFYQYMEEHFFSSIEVSDEQKYIPHSDPDNAEEECDKLETFITDVGGIDLQLLGLGENGHIAFIEPGSELPADTYVVDLEENSRPNADSFKEGEVPSQAISLGIGTTMKSRAIVLVAVGKGKAEIVKRAFTGPISTKIPATFLQMHPNITIYLDEDSAALLPGEMYRKVNIK
jgi:glucosamine-6-phosphate deaminase